MAFYSVCSMIIESDLLPAKYQPFLIESDNHPENIDMTICKVDHSHVKTDMQRVARLSYMNIWKDVDSENKTHWIFELLNHMGTVSVDDHFSRVEIYNCEFNGIFYNQRIGDIYSPYIQIILECRLIQNGYTILHSACVEIDGNAYAFTGPSGIGKSTRAGNWCKLLGAEWISGDRPAINVLDGIVYGVPWDGKEAIYRNYHCPLKAIFKVNRSENTYIQEMTEKQKYQLLCEQTVVPLWDPVLTLKAMQSIRNLIKVIPIYDIYCDITDESTIKAYQMVIDKICK